MSEIESLPGEEWRVIARFPYYSVSNMGRVLSRNPRNKQGPILLKPSVPKTARAYHSVCLHQDGRSRSVRVHVLVLEAFVGPRPEGADGRHLDDNPQNNRLDNLCWGTRSENMEDCIRNGNGNAGENHYRTNLDNETVLEIRRLWCAGVPTAEIAAKTGETPGNVSDIGSGAIWKRLPWEEGTKPTLRSRKKMMEYQGESKSMMDWSKDPRCPLSYSGLKKSLLRGFSLEEIFTCERTVSRNRRIDPQRKKKVKISSP